MARHAVVVLRFETAEREGHVLARWQYSLNGGDLQLGGPALVRTEELVERVTSVVRSLSREVVNVHDRNGKGPDP